MDDYKLSDVRKELIHKNVIDISGEIKGDMVKYVRTCIMILKTRNSPDVDVFISTSGGNLSAGLHIYDMLRNYPGKTTGIVINTARSSGIPILLGCQVRKSYEHACLLLHGPALEKVPVDEWLSSRKRKKKLKKLIKSRELLYEVVKKETGKSRQDIHRRSRRNKDMTAQEALAFGLIQEII